MDAEAEAPSACSSVGLRLRVSTGREPCVVLLRLVIQTRSYLLSCHEATSGGADTRHAETTQHWVERPLRETLQLLFGLEDAAAASLIESGAVYLEQRRATVCAAPVPARSQLRVHLQPKQHALPEKLTIVECAEEFVVCCKPSGVPVHPTVDSLQQNLLWAAAAQLRMRLLPTSRLDEGTSGLVLLARTERLQARFNEQLRRREVTKEYVALVLLDPPPQSLQPSSLQQPLQPLPPLPPAGHACAAACAAPPPPPAPPMPPPPPARPAALREGTVLEHWMERRPRAPMRLSAASIEGWARCESEVLRVRCMQVRRRDLRSGGGGGGGGGGASDAKAAVTSALIVAEVTLRLHTGRTHQLRAQLGFVGHPVLGDEMYGSAPLRELRELCRLDTAPEGPLPSLPVAWLPERPFALHSWKLRFAGWAAEPENLAASSRGSGGSGDGGGCRQVTHAYEVQPPWTV